MSYRYNIQVQVDDTIHEVGGFDTARAAAVSAHVEATHFGTQHQSSSDTEAAIETGEKSIEVRAADPRIVVVVS